MAGGQQRQKATISSPLQPEHCHQGVQLEPMHSRKLQLEYERQSRKMQKLIEQKNEQPHTLMKLKLEQHREMAGHMRAMTAFFSPDTPAVLAHAIAIMDSALLQINVRGKYLSCFSAACYLLASKWVLDDDSASPSALAQIHQKQWKEQDLVRMEMKVLEVLEWELPQVTYLSFLPPMLHALFQWDPLAAPPPSVMALAQCLLIHHFSFHFKPAAVALGVLNHIVLKCGNPSVDAFLTIMALQDTVHVLDSELHEIDRLLTTLTARPSSAVFRTNRCLFPKVFTGPYRTFLPDHKLHAIPEAPDHVTMETSYSRCLSPAVSASGSFAPDFDGSYSEDESEELGFDPDVSVTAVVKSPSHEAEIACHHDMKNSYSHEMKNGDSKEVKNGDSDVVKNGDSGEMKNSDSDETKNNDSDEMKNSDSNATKDNDSDEMKNSDSDVVKNCDSDVVKISGSDVVEISYANRMKRCDCNKLKNRASHEVTNSDSNEVNNCNSDEVKNGDSDLDQDSDDQDSGCDQSSDDHDFSDNCTPKMKGITQSDDSGLAESSSDEIECCECSCP